MKFSKKDFYNVKANNEKILLEWEKAENELYSSQRFNEKRLRSCSAETFETENYIFLRSYHTIVAFIEKSTGNLYDVLRYVYGYTSTSAQHISKFYQDFFNKRSLTAKRFCYFEI